MSLCEKQQLFANVTCMTPYFGTIEEETLANENFRQVVFTGEHVQVVLMSLLPGEEIGMETHPHVDQFFRIESGMGKAVVAGVEYELRDGTALVVPAGAEHNIISTGAASLKLYTLYSPPNHPAGTIHHTKEDALRAEATHHDA